MNRVFVIGSINVDILMLSDHLPEPGETIKAGSFYVYPGGKGANQAISSARMGANTTLIGKIGNDYFGSLIKDFIGKENLNSIIMYGQKTGMAFINVDKNGKNMISVFSGANNDLREEDLKDIKIDNSIIMLQQEIPMDTIEYVIKIYGRNNLIITDPSPINEINDFVLSGSDYITPNEVEASKLSGMHINSREDAFKASEILYKKYQTNIIIKLGSYGSLLNNGNEIRYFKPSTVNARDTTGAGDCFNGAFAAMLTKTSDVNKSIEIANMAAALSVTEYGAFPSFPYLNDVKTKFNLNIN